MLRFGPQYRSVPWGGRRLHDALGRAIPDGPVGESWELVDFGEHHSQVRQGPHEGKGLGELWRDGALGGSGKGPFPFLLKWLDTADRLSVQVHPDAECCHRLGQGAPKTEAWYVAHAEPEAHILLGHYPGLDAATLRQAATGGTIAKWLYETKPRVGDMILVPAGTLHAVGPGLLLLEVQQPSDSTYRVYDWDRPGLDGKPRQLHLDEACACVRFDHAGAPRPQRREVRGPCFVMRQLAVGGVLPPENLRVVISVGVADNGPAILETARGEEQMQRGDVVVAEPADGAIKLKTGACLLITETEGGHEQHNRSR